MLGPAEVVAVVDRPLRAVQTVRNLVAGAVAEGEATLAISTVGSLLVALPCPPLWE
jgi:hypothetical protein